jgi:hypothetical protein
MAETLRISSRRELEGLIEALIALCDALDGDPDLEAGGDEEPDPPPFCNWQEGGDQTRLLLLDT